MARKRFDIVLARTAGFCMGVRRAVRMVLNAADEPNRPAPIRSCGPLIHNRHVLQVLESRGISALSDGDDDGQGTVVIRAHGLSRQEQDELRGRCEDLLDATCPHVRRVQKIVEKYAQQGYACVVVGDAGHAEVNGVLSFAGPAGHVVSGPDEVADLPAADKVVVVAQTTQDADLFHKTLQKVRERFGECLAFETICRSTERRQAEAREMARKVDAMIVVGGFDSANTRRLAEICAAAGTRTFHVETERDLDVEEILQCEKVGLTAGASTPNWMIRRVVRHLEDEHRRRTHPWRYRCRTILRGLVNVNIYAAGGAAALTFTCSQLLSRPPRLLGLCMAVAFFFVLGQHLLNQYGRRRALYLAEPGRADFLMANEKTLLWLGICSSALAVFLALFLGWWAFALVALGSVGGLMYRVRLPRALTVRTGFRSLEQLPGSKELFVGLAWGALAAVVPALAAPQAMADWRGVLVAFVVAFLLAFQRTLAQDMRDVEADQLVGRETLAGVLGPRVAERLFFGLLVLLAAVIAGVGCIAEWSSPFCFPLLACVPYALVYFTVLRRRKGPEGELAEALIDGQFYVIGLIALIWNMATSSA
ncbi:MAG: 4-hydroxy-3-methylbut-2-enyl diphosphate reductase [Planctomycetota bacterium]|jgi:4-hydroxy-3-methylbut-2-enyl diphosphate reductase